MTSDVIRVGQMEIRYLVDGSGSGGLGVFELVVPPGANAPPPPATASAPRTGA